MFQIDVKKKLLAALVLILNIFPVQVFANYTINSDTTYTSSIALDALNPVISIVSGGNLSFSNSGNASAIFGQSRTDFQLIVSANSGQGISSSGASAPAITIYQGLLAANINSGRVTSNSTYGTIEFWDSAAGTNSVNIVSGTSVSNTKSTAGSAIWYHNLSSNQATLNIINAGTIQVENDATSTAIRFDDSNGGSTLNVTNSGTINAGALGRAVYLTGSNVGAITNSGTITGSLTGGSSAFNVTNTAGSISGDISLGSNSASSLDISGGAVTGNVTFGNGYQVIGITGGSFSGGLIGVGAVDLGSSGTFALNSLSSTTATSDFTAPIRGSSTGAGSLIINASQDVTAGANIGASHAINTLTLNSDAILRLDTNNKILSANNVTLNSGSKLYVGSGAFNTAITAAESGSGSVYFANNTTLSGDIGSSSVSLNHVDFAASKMIFANKHTISASNIVIGAGTLLIDAANLAGAVSNDGVIYLNSSSSTTATADFTATIDGGSDYSGILLIEGNQDITAGANIGGIHPVAGVLFNENGILRLNEGTSKSLTAQEIILTSGAKIYVGSAAIHGDIASYDASNVGEVYLTANNTLGGNIGLSGFALNRVEISPSAVITAGTKNIEALNIVLGANSVLNTSATVAATNITVAGQLNLEKETGNNLTGNIAGNSGGEINLNAFSHVVTGDLTLNSGAILAADISTSTIAGNITVSGAATIDANAILKLSLPGSTAFGSHYTLVAGGSSSSLNKISDSNITIDNLTTNHVGIFSFSTSVVGNNLIVEVDRYKIPELTNSNHSSFYNVIAENYDASGSLLTLQQYLDSTSNSNGQKAAALDSANSELDNSHNRIVFDNVNKAIDLVSNRISALSGGDFHSGISSGDNDLKKSAWIEIVGSNTHQGNAAGLDGYGANSNGIIIGLDKKLDNDVIVGVAGLYSNSAIKSTSAVKRTDITSYQINLYGSKEFENFFLNAVAGMGFNRYSSNRSINAAGVNAGAKYSGNNYVARVEVGKNFKTENNFIFTPILRLTAANNSINSYDESGAGTLNLSVKNDSTNFLEGRAGAALSKSYRVWCDNILVPSFSLSYGYDFIGDRQKTTANFIGQSATFGSSAARIAQGSTKVGIGLKLYGSNDVSVAMGYEFDQRSKYHSHNGFLRAKYSF